MSPPSPLDLVTKGLGRGTALGLVTKGLISTEELEPIEGVPLGDLQIDARLDFDLTALAGDLLLEGPHLAVELGLGTGVLLSLFTDRRAEDDEELPPGEDDPRGWWGDGYPSVAGDRIGSRLWLLAREKQLPEVLVRARGYTLEALDWLREDQIAESVEVVAEFVALGVMGLEITIQRPPAEEIAFRFRYLWQETG